MIPPRLRSKRRLYSLKAASSVRRRRFMALGASAGATLLAGCSQSADLNDPDDSDGTGTNFRLLISDLPADIGDFDRLDVSFESARVFDGGGDESSDSNDEETEGVSEDDDEEPEDTPEGGDDDEGTEDSTDDESAESDDESVETDDDVERRRGFYVIDLDDATVDLTQVVGDRAIPIFEGELSEGTYEKIELNVSDIEGIVDGERVEVKVPSEKLQITTLFELSPDATVAFVFDINVVKRGPENGYNLTPVISKSGIAGEDVEVEEVDGESEETEDGERAETDEEPEAETDGEPETGTDGEPEEGENEGAGESEDDPGEKGEKGEKGGAANAGGDSTDGEGDEEADDGDGDGADDPSDGDE